MMIEAERMAANSPDGNAYLWGMCKGHGMTAQCLPAATISDGMFIKKPAIPSWNPYDEDLLDVMEAMVAAEPETDDGQKTYGCGAWFGLGTGLG